MLAVLHPTGFSEWGHAAGSELELLKLRGQSIAVTGTCLLPAAIP